MPAKQKTGSSTSWGISWADVGQALQDCESHNNCTIEFRVDYIALYKGASFRTWNVTALARVHRGKPNEICGLGTCSMGGNKGAASMAGAYLRALLDACDNLQDRKDSVRKRPVVEQLPLPE